MFSIARQLGITVAAAGITYIVGHVLGESPPTPEQVHERSSDVSVALLSLLERLSPEARAAFLLRDVFEVGYPEIADVLGKTEATVRQIVHRAKEHLREGPARYAVSPESHIRIVQRFAQAMARGEFKIMKAMLAETAELVGDGGGKVLSFPKPLLGGQRIAQLFYASNLRYKNELRIDPVGGDGGCVGGEGWHCSGSDVGGVDGGVRKCL